MFKAAPTLVMPHFLLYRLDFKYCNWHMLLGSIMLSDRINFCSILRLWYFFCLCRLVKKFTHFIYRRHSIVFVNCTIIVDCRIASWVYRWRVCVYCNKTHITVLNTIHSKSILNHSSDTTHCASVYNNKYWQRRQL